MAAKQQHGILIIPDISGFTEFVSEVEISHSEHIITDLLSLLINTNSLGLVLCEIEGDALFFYRGGRMPTIDEVIGQARHWFLSFHSHLNLLKRDNFCKCGACQDIGNLGLKIVGHTGDFAVYNLDKKVKVIGKDVILVHRLLKNSLDSSEYLLLSAKMLEDMGTQNTSGWEFQMAEETYPVLGEVSVGSVNLGPLLNEVPATPPKDEVPELDSSFSVEILIEAPLDIIVAYLTDHKTWPNWVAGLDEMIVDESEPLRPGHHHVCKFPGQEFSISLDQIDEKKDRFTMVNSIKPPSVLKKLLVIYEAKKVDGGVKVRETYSYARKPIVGRIFDIKNVPMLLEASRASLQNLKLLVENEVAS